MASHGTLHPSGWSMLWKFVKQLMGESQNDLPSPELSGLIAIEPSKNKKKGKKNQVCTPLHYDNKNFHTVLLGVWEISETSENISLKKSHLKCKYMLNYKNLPRSVPNSVFFGTRYYCSSIKETIVIEMHIVALMTPVQTSEKLVCLHMTAKEDGYIIILSPFQKFLPSQEKTGQWGRAFVLVLV